jgi:hypothetical protein
MPLPLTIDDAKSMLERYAETALIICAANRELRTMDYATYGRDAEDKLWAAEVGDRLAAWMGGELINAKDFRADPLATSAAFLREALDLLTEVVREKAMLSMELNARINRLLART